MRSVLITGGTGFFGRAFVRSLLERRELDRICVFSRCEYRQAVMRVDLGEDPRLRWFVGDVRDRDRITRAMDRCDVVVHAAALKRVEVGHYNPDEMVKTNILGAMNVIEAARDAANFGAVPQPRRVVFLSSDKAFEPVSPYGQSKAIAESLFLAANRSSDRWHGPRFAVTRYGNVAGSTGSVIPTWRRMLEVSDTVPVTDPECTRFWMSIDEAVQLVMRTIDMMPTEPAIPELPAFRLGDLAEAMGARMNVRGLGAFEKRHESMCPGRSSDRAPRLAVSQLRERLATLP
jgi:UDP-N-acetylglucosamine 4,6-dehydratase/5-epimerase